MVSGVGGAGKGFLARPGWCFVGFALNCEDGKGGMAWCGIQKTFQMNPEIFVRSTHWASKDDGIWGPGTIVSGTWVC